MAVTRAHAFGNPKEGTGGKGWAPGERAAVCLSRGDCAKEMPIFCHAIHHTEFGGPQGAERRLPDSTTQEGWVGCFRALITSPLAGGVTQCERSLQLDPTRELLQLPSSPPVSSSRSCRSLGASYRGGNSQNGGTRAVWEQCVIVWACGPSRDWSGTVTGQTL